MNIKVKQKDITDCGAACLAAVSAYYRLKLPVTAIRQIAGTDKRGTNVLGMVEAARKIGFDAKGIKCNFENLKELPKPAIAHVALNGNANHYVVVTKITEKNIVIMDPFNGRIYRKTHAEFQAVWSGVMIILVPGTAFESGDHVVSVNARFWRLIRPHKKVLLQIILGALGYTVLGLSTSVYVQKLIDFVLIDGNKNLLNAMGIGMIAILIIQLFIGVIRSLFTIRTGQMIDAQLILGYYRHLLRLPQQFFDNMRIGEIISRINDAVKIRVFLNDVSVTILVNIFIVLFSFVMMFTYNARLSLIILSVIPLYFIVYVISNRLNKRVQKATMISSANLESQLVEGLNAISTIKRFNIEQQSNDKIEEKFGKLLHTVYTSGTISLFSVNATELISRTITIILLWLGATYVLSNELTAGELISFYTLIGYFTTPMNALIGANKTIQEAKIAAERLFEIMEIEEEDSSAKISLTTEKTGDIRFEDLTFRYGARVSVFQSLNLHIRKGDFTAIVGESGSGKSTLMSLLHNIYPIQQGRISIGGTDLRYFSDASIRRIIGVVPQQIDLFAGNIIDNIAVGEYEPDLGRVMDICDQLGLTSFIDRLPAGFDTYVGENGVALSGGQRQRLAIARALYREPEILILDEATSSLDSVSERFVQNMIGILKEKKKTVIVIAHRLSTIMKADHIVVLDKGRVVEEGRHEDLLANRSDYTKLWNYQFPEVPLAVSSPVGIELINQSA